MYFNGTIYNGRIKIKNSKRKMISILLSLCILLSGNTALAMNELQNSVEIQQFTETAIQEVADTSQTNENIVIDLEDTSETSETAYSESEDASQITKPAEAEVQTNEPAMSLNSDVDAPPTTYNSGGYLLYDSADLTNSIDTYDTLQDAFNAVNNNIANADAYTIIVQNDDDMNSIASLTTNKKVTLTSSEGNNYVLKKISSGRHISIKNGALILSNITLD